MTGLRGAGDRGHPEAAPSFHIGELSFAYRGRGRSHQVFESLTWSSSARMIALMGPSGSGKSTLLRILAGVQKADSGTVTVHGQRTTDDVGGARPRVAMIHQDYRLVDFLTVSDNLRLAAEMAHQRLSDEEIDRRLRAVHLPTGVVSSYPDDLSGGEQQRVAIVRALVTRPRVIVADEPTGALDAVTTERISQVLHDISRQGSVTVVVATHDVRVAAHADEVYLVTDTGLHLQ